MSVPNVNCKIRYIQNEDNIAKSPALTEKYGEKRKFYSCNKADDYLKYMDKGSKEKIDYIEYSGDDEKSCGVFLVLVLQLVQGAFTHATGTGRGGTGGAGKHSRQCSTLFC